MDIYPNTCYHIYNRTINNEPLFRERENFRFFLTKYRQYCAPFLDTLAYCLMPTHFHFLVYIHSEETTKLQKHIGVMLSSYTQAYNKRYRRHGNLFQASTKAKPVNDTAYLSTVAAYIHNNPIRSQLVQSPEEWEFSSYRDYCGMREGTLPDKSLIMSIFHDVEAFREFSRNVVKIDAGLWV